MKEDPMRRFKLLGVFSALVLAVGAVAPVARTTPESERSFVAVLLPVEGAPVQGVGVLFFRQPEDTEKVVFLDVFVLNLEPNHSYSLQRATDETVDGDCKGTNWLTLGRDLEPQAIETNAFGFGVAHLSRSLALVPTGKRFDIHFRVIDAATSAVVLVSGCHQYTVLP
jgi:hypothetical protein